MLTQKYQNNSRCIFEKKNFVINLIFNLSKNLSMCMFVLKIYLLMTMLTFLKIITIFHILFVMKIVNSVWIVLNENFFYSKFLIAFSYNSKTKIMNLIVNLFFAFLWFVNVHLLTLLSLFFIKRIIIVLIIFYWCFNTSSTSKS